VAISAYFWFAFPGWRRGAADTLCDAGFAATQTAIVISSDEVRMKIVLQ